MEKIQLIYAKNIIAGRKHFEQELEFVILVPNLAYEKKIHVLWAEEGGKWKEFKADYLCPAGRGLEIWRASARFRNGRGLPGDINFALRYQVLGKEYWDNNRSRNYLIKADSGVLVHPDFPLRHIEFNRSLSPGQKFRTIAVAVHESVGPKSIEVHWTTDHWKNQRQTPCHFQRYYWHENFQSTAANPNRYGWLVWTGHIPIDQAYRIEYAISCETQQGRIWDNNFNGNYQAQRERLKILTLNLHCYQEENQEEKFNQIVRAIGELNLALICLQEVGENWNQGKGDRKSNAARIIRDRLKKSYDLTYHLHTDWSHIGFGKYREGVAVLSKYKFHFKHSSYLTKNQDIHNIHSRKVVMVQVHVPGIGAINVYSVHLSWWDGGFQEQFENLSKWVEMENQEGPAATLLCGDFNVKAGSTGYFLVTGSREYEDQFLAATEETFFRRVFRQPTAQDLEKALVNDQRIDFIFEKKAGALKAVSARVLFTESDYGLVSDHFGYLVEFEPF